MFLYIINRLNYYGRPIGDGKLVHIDLAGSKLLPPVEQETQITKDKVNIPISVHERCCVQPIYRRLQRQFVYTAGSPISKELVYYLLLTAKLALVRVSSRGECFCKTWSTNSTTHLTVMFATITQVPQRERVKVANECCTYRPVEIQAFSCIFICQYYYQQSVVMVCILFNLLFEAIETIIFFLPSRISRIFPLFFFYGDYRLWMIEPIYLYNFDISTP